MIKVGRMNESMRNSGTSIKTKLDLINYMNDSSPKVEKNSRYGDSTWLYFSSSEVSRDELIKALNSSPSAKHMLTFSSDIYYDLADCSLIIQGNSKVYISESKSDPEDYFDILAKYPNQCTAGKDLNKSMLRTYMDNNVVNNPDKLIKSTGSQGKYDLEDALDLAKASKAARTMVSRLLSEAKDILDFSRVDIFNPYGSKAAIVIDLKAGKTFKDAVGRFESIGGTSSESKDHYSTTYKGFNIYLGTGKGGILYSRGIPYVILYLAK